MVRLLDAATQGAVRDRSRIIPRDFVLFSLTDDETFTSYGFTNFGEDVSVNVVLNGAGDVGNYAFYGDNAPLQSIDAIPLKIGLEVDTIQVVMNPLHPIVQIMARGNEQALRTARVQIFRGYLDPASMLLVANPRSRFLGQVNTAPERVAAVGGQSVRTINVRSHTHEMTRTSPAKKSDETYKLRSGDRFGQYSGTAGKWELWWGEVKGATS
ncbi:hypothetical protein [Devosia chinhatensis]|uniref:Uncharacterized protein n=1 Tax=Devosia chinhatensis TaxID=429727 RepID=A0A0F5FMH0_9HYPH|nr:hypothetical protein [Devosia chinhatensis]KKB09412.1 hypothetical protein VE26_05610 [Devosia chinhatensis]